MGGGSICFFAKSFLFNGEILSWINHLDDQSALVTRIFIEFIAVGGNDQFLAENCDVRIAAVGSFRKNCDRSSPMAGLPGVDDQIVLGLVLVSDEKTVVLVYAINIRTHKTFG